MKGLSEAGGVVQSTTSSHVIDETAAKSAVLEAERRRQQALVAVDIAALDDLFADDLVHIHSTGLVHTKAQLLRHIEHRRAFVSVERGPLEIRINGNIAVMTGHMINRMRAQEGGHEVVLDGFVTQVLRDSSDGWKFINFQLTPKRES
jgi:ketosteroid isomerase-like protein